MIYSLLFIVNVNSKIIIWRLPKNTSNSITEDVHSQKEFLRLKQLPTSNCGSSSVQLDKLKKYPGPPSVQRSWSHLARNPYHSKWVVAVCLMIKIKPSAVIWFNFLTFEENNTNPQNRYLIDFMGKCPSN